MSDSVRYRERLVVPVSWWLLAAGFVMSFWLVLAVALPGVAVWAISGAVALLAVALLLGYGAVQISVGSQGVGVGRAQLEWSACGAIEALDAEATRNLQGRHADARAFLVVRPYLRRSVRLDVDDAADSTPYWLISTRHPERLVAAVSSTRPQR